MSYNFGIIGLGLIADIHAKAISRIKNAKVTACYSRSQDKADEFAKEHNCKGYSNLNDFFKHSNLDIVTICTPSGYHLEPALEAINAGKHLIIEKPLEITLKRCDQIINRAIQQGTELGVIFQSRFYESAQFIKKEIENNKFGRLVLGDAYAKYYRSQEYYDEGGWHGTKKYDGGGALMNQSIHAIDLLQWYMGKVHSVQAFTNTIGHQNIEVEDNAVAAIRFENGALGVIEGSTSIYPGFLKRIEISGTEGSVFLEDDYIKEFSTHDKNNDKKILKKYGTNASLSGAASDPGALKLEGHKNQFIDFINAIENKRKPLVDGIESRKSVEIIRAIYKSAEKGKAIRIK